MARKAIAHNRADVRRAIKMMDALGKTVTQVNFHPDGAFDVIASEQVIGLGFENSPDMDSSRSFDEWKAKRDARST